MCTNRLIHSNPENEETFLPGMKRILANEEILLLNILIYITFLTYLLCIIYPN